jgi:hypothetical protein
MHRRGRKEERKEKTESAVKAIVWRTLFWNAFVFSFLLFAFILPQSKKIRNPILQLF